MASALRQTQDDNKLTPMMRQYKQLKEKYSDCLLLFRLGDFYEMFNEDAVMCSRLLNITLTKRQTAPMCGIPHHALDSYLGRLTRAGKKVAICEQLSDPELPGIVKRDVIRVVTPGTTFDERILDKKENRFLISVVFLEKKIGLALCDVTTGLFQVARMENEEQLREEIFRLKPAECIVDAAEKTLPEFLKQFEKLPVFPHQFWDEPKDFLRKHFGVKDLRGFGIEDFDEVTAAAGLLLDYLIQTQKSDLGHIRPPQMIARGNEMILDETAIRNLEIFESLREGKREGSLISVIDATQTPMGGRTLRNWLMHPLHDKALIERRLDAVGELIAGDSAKNEMGELLKGVLDLERLLARLSIGGGSGRDILGIAISLKILEPLGEILKNFKSEFIGDLRRQLEQLTSLTVLRDKILNSIVEAPPLSAREGGVIKDGVNKELDSLRAISREGKGFVSRMQEEEIKKTGINSLKVRFNQVFGYYIEITKANLAAVPPNYIRKQTLVNCERFITPELKDFEEKILGAEAKINELEYALFLELRLEVTDAVRQIQQAAAVFGALDTLISFAAVAQRNSFCRPLILDEGEKLKIKNGRHPVVENLASGRFVPNDTFLSNDGARLMLITGPNMGGKSTYLRQVALIAFMAHVGCYVPAQEAKISLVDRIFTRVGASDNLVRGQSTFMVEMQEAAQILHYATKNSLIILDEIGRGTSTYDGVSLAWAILEYIHDKIAAKTLFATHYHELIGVVDKLSHAENHSVAVKEEAGAVVFLYRVACGAVDRSYGIEVARLAGLPAEVISNAKNILNDLEEEVLDKAIITRAKSGRQNEAQMDIFTAERPHRAIEELKKIDVNKMTPMEALQKLDELKKLEKT